MTPLLAIVAVSLVSFGLGFHRGRAMERRRVLRLLRQSAENAWLLGEKTARLNEAMDRVRLGDDP